MILKYRLLSNDLFHYCLLKDFNCQMKNFYKIYFSKRLTYKMKANSFNLEPNHDLKTLL